MMKIHMEKLLLIKTKSNHILREEKTMYDSFISLKTFV